MITDTRSIYIYDLEIFPNYFLAMFYDIENDSFSSYTVDSLDELRQFLEQQVILIGYNNRGYDDIILHEIVHKTATSCSELYDLSTKIVSGGARNDSHLKRVLYKTPSWGTIDLMQIKPPNLSGKVFDWSLKKHQIRLRWNDVRDLPYPFDTMLSEGEKQEVFNYCKNDVFSTHALFTDYLKQGVFDVARKIQELYPFVNTKPFYTSHASLGAEIMKVLYRKHSGIRLSKVIKTTTKEAIFEPSRHISDLIAFTDARNQQALEYLKNLPSENVVNLATVNGRKVNNGCKDWGSKYLKDLRFYAGDTEFRVGVGGIHTDFPQRHVVGNLIDFDVTSYYPSLIKQINRSPLGLTDEWIKQFIDPYAKRVMFKQQGDKLSADVMKIVINSVYGQLNYPKSDSFDPTLQLQVTLNGQLMLIMLAEMFAEENFEIVSANTDGITVNVTDRKEHAVEIGSMWIRKTGHNLEHTEYKQYVAVSVNDYFAVTHEGDVKAKGWFRTTSGLSPAVLPKAVIQYFTAGASIEAHIREQTNLFDFINFGQAPKGVDGFWKNKRLQKTNRWYRSCEGEPIFYTATVKGEQKRRKLPGSDSCVPVNSISSTIVPEDLDYDHYIAEAEKVVRGIESNLPSTRKDTGELLYQAKKLAEQGLTIQPKGRKNTPKANYPGAVPTEKAITSIEDYPWYQYNGVGIVTGPGLNTIAIDIDYLDKAVHSAIFNHTQKSKSHLTAWHGPHKRVDVASGACRGTMIFEYNGNRLKPTDGSFLREYGFEILYGKKVAQVLGVHQNGEPYQFQGTLKPLPTRLETFLTECLEASKRFVENNCDDEGRTFTIPLQPTEPEEQCDNHQINQLTRFRDVANAVPEYKGNLELGEYKGLTQLIGSCPYNHDDDTGDHFHVYYDEEKSVYRPHCFHNNCKATIKKFTKHVSENIITRVKDVQTISCLTEEQASVREALQSPDRIKTILAPTGTGKTYETAYYVAKALEQVTNEKYVILCSTKGQMIQYCKELQGILQTDNLNELGIDLIESSSSIEEGRTKSRNDVRDNTIVAITTFAYASRRGFSKSNYAFVKYIDDKTHVLIDEIDSFIENQRQNAPFGWRGRTMTVSGEVKSFYTTKCLVSDGTGNCTQCRMEQYNGNDYSFDAMYYVWKYQPRFALEQRTHHTPNPHYDFSQFIHGAESFSDTVEITRLKENPAVREILTENDEDVRDFEGTIQDLIETSYKPTAWRSFISRDGVEISTNEVKDHYIDDENHLDYRKIIEEKVKFPHHACNVITLTLTDKVALTHIGNAKSVTTLTATLSIGQKEYLHNVLGEQRIITVKPNEAQKVDDMTIIGLKGQLSDKMFDNIDLNEKKTLIFKTTKNKAHKRYEELKNKGSVLLGNDVSDYRSSRSDVSAHDIVVTHSRGTLGRGINLPQYKVVFVDSRAYKPMFAFSADTQDELVRLQDEDRAATILQNVGRVLRREPEEREAHRVIVIENLETDDQFNAVVESISTMANGHIDTIYLRAFVKKNVVEEEITYATKNNRIKNSQLATFDGLIALFHSYGKKGKSLTEVNEAAGWKSVARHFTEDEKVTLKGAYDSGVLLFAEERNVESGDGADAKTLRLRERRMKRIEALAEKGLKKGKMKNMMNVPKWDESEQEWFENTVDELLVPST